MASTTSPNMNLIIPGVGTEAGPTYAFDVNTSLTLLDQHDHSPGKGIQITPAGLNIDTDLTINSNSITDVLTAVFTASTSASTTPMSLSVAPGGEPIQQQDLWYTPDTGIPIQLTKNGIVNATASSIDGETYSSGTFYWTQAQDSLPTTPANFDIGSVTIRPNTALTTFGVTLSPSTSISSQYSIQLPLLPSSQKIMTLDASGNMTAPYVVDGSTITIVSNTIGVPAGGITNTQIAMNTITGNRLVNQTIGYDQLAPGFNGTWNVNTVIITASFAVRVATTVAGTLATSFENGDTVDGVVLVTNDLILIKNQVSSTEDGVYTVNATGSPTRSTSYDTAAELTYAGVTVTLGTVNAGTKWFQNNVLSTLSDPQSWSNAMTTTMTIPTNVNFILTEVVGGGAGGGGGKGGSGGAGGGGGGGGGGGQITQDYIAVTPGESLIITVGNGGAFGAGGASATAGNNGISGVTSSIYIPSSNRVIEGVGGLFGQGGGQGVVTSGGNGGNGAGFFDKGTGGAGGTTGNPGVAGTYNGGSGAGGGGGGNANGAGAAGTRSKTITSASTGGATNNGGGAGGGGGSALVVGGNGGDGGTSLTAGGTPTADTGAGGGGGGGRGTSATPGANGGAGSNGIVKIYWIGSP